MEKIMFMGTSIQNQGFCCDLELSMQSQRCIHIPSDQDGCPGRISAFRHCQTQEDCLKLNEVFSSYLSGNDKGNNREVIIHGKTI
jgi:hypothetical protein